MGAKSGFALRFLQWFIRGIQFCCAALVLAVYSYFLATLRNHNLPIQTKIRAVEGISGVGVLYTGLGLLLLCCLAGHPFTSFIAIVLDVCFLGAFIYVAVENRAGASSCRGKVTTPYGTGDADTNVSDNGKGGFTVLPNQHQACQLETACLAVSILAVFFFIFSILTEVALARHRKKEKRFGPSPANNYTSGYGKEEGAVARPGRLARLFGFGRNNTAGAGDPENPNALPAHATPGDVRDSYGTEQTRVDNSQHGAGDPITATGPYEKYGRPPAAADGTHAAHFPPANYQYDDGVYNSRA